MAMRSRKNASATSWKSGGNLEMNSEKKAQTQTGKWTLSVLNPKSLRELVERFGFSEVCSLTGMGPWTVARIIESDQR